MPSEYESKIQNFGRITKGPYYFSDFVCVCVTGQIKSPAAALLLPWLLVKNKLGVNESDSRVLRGSNGVCTLYRKAAIVVHNKVLQCCWIA